MSRIQLYLFYLIKYNLKDFNIFFIFHIVK